MVANLNRCRGVYDPVSTLKGAVVAVWHAKVAREQFQDAGLSFAELRQMLHFLRAILFA